MEQEDINFKKIRLNNIEKIKGTYPLSADIDFNVLPLLKKTEMRSVREISLRAVSLGIFKLISVFPEDIDWYSNWIEINDFSFNLSNRERNTIIKGVVSKKDEIDYSWYQECINGIMWILGIDDAIIDKYDETNCSKLMKYLPPEVSLSTFQRKIKMRTQKDLFINLDFYYLLHWLSKRYNNISLSVVRERRRVFEWCLDKEIEDWDNISLDT